jgi:hypothetical protein
MLEYLTSRAIFMAKLVKLNYDENATLRLPDKIFMLKSVENAVRTTKQEQGPDPDSGAALKFYPFQSGNKIVSGLLK